MSPAEALDKAVVLHRAGDLAAAETLYRAILEAVPDAPDPCHLLALIFHARGELDQAVDWARKACQFLPTHAPFQESLAYLLTERGIARQNAGQADLAEADYREAISANSKQAVALCNLGTILRDKNQIRNAQALFETAMAADPTLADARFNLATLFLDGMVLNKAQALYAALLAEAPDHPGYLSALGNCLRLMGRTEEAIELLARAEALLSDDALKAKARVNRGLAMLQRSDFKGFGFYEARFAVDAEASGWRDLEIPSWDGGTLAGQSVHAWLEQGLGDQLLFATLLPDLVAEAGHVVVECDGRLTGLLERSIAGIEAVPRLVPSHARLRQGDLNCSVPAGSLAARYRRSLDDFRRSSLRLIPDPARARNYQDQLKSFGPGLRVGLLWRGLLRSPERMPYYLNAEDLAPVVQACGAQFVCLQINVTTDEILTLEKLAPHRFHQIPGLDLRDDIEGVVALCQGLDLVISPSASGGAIAALTGTRVFQFGVGPGDIDALGTDHLPWFPTVRCFRRKWDEDWTPVLTAMRDAIAEMTKDFAP